MKKIISVFVTFIMIMIGVSILAINSTKGESEKEKSKIEVVATLFPQYDFVKQIGKDKVLVSLLLPPRNRNTYV